ncbi:photosynthetic reaction center subunit M [Novosphingopyxis sp. YJ-S2-01]|uniref:photosynthetic reaction center subunit M n=1 Tax=Novosphingopyxis sp. YJ-S2-01 TaxID=2794021 RepID=UPI0018DEC93A|nr:photosynthetic reaction center subunit M [Novosphingopyxis sp. YJ-S2-01]MBH9536773.1 photosynthetic reaction center subunit M [Novosphingopyxis sp. YJ-S2-01]
MGVFESFYSQVLIDGPPDPGPDLPPGDEKRINTHVFVRLLGKIGDPQLGPFYLGWAGILSILFGLLAFEIIGLNMAAQADWNPMRFAQGVIWNGIDPPPAKYGLSLFPPLTEGGWWLIAGFCLTVSVCLWWVRLYRRAKSIGMGSHVALAFGCAIFLFLSLGLIRPVLMGDWSEAPNFGIIPHLNWTATVSVLYGNWYYNPFHMFSIVFLYGSTMLFAMHGGTILATSKYGSERESREIVDRGTASERAALFWRWTMGFNATMESIHRWAWWFAVLTVLAGGIGVLLTGTVVDNWYLWGMKHGMVPEYEYPYAPTTPPNTLDGYIAPGGTAAVVTPADPSLAAEQGAGR